MNFKLVLWWKTEVKYIQITRSVLSVSGARTWLSCIAYCCLLWANPWAVFFLLSGHTYNQGSVILSDRMFYFMFRIYHPSVNSQQLGFVNKRLWRHLSISGQVYITRAATGFTALVCTIHPAMWQMAHVLGSALNGRVRQGQVTCLFPMRIGVSTGWESWAIYPVEGLQSGYERPVYTLDCCPAHFFPGVAMHTRFPLREARKSIIEIKSRKVIETFVTWSECLHFCQANRACNFANEQSQNWPRHIRIYTVDYRKYKRLNMYIWWLFLQIIHPEPSCRR